MSFALYMVGFAIFMGGVVWGAFEAGIPHVYIGIGNLAQCLAQMLHGRGLADEHRDGVFVLAARQRGVERRGAGAA